jgi:hypothetical protein
MEPMSPDEKLFVQNLEKSVQELGFSRAEVLVNLVFLKSSKSPLRGQAHRAR